MLTARQVCVAQNFLLAFAVVFVVRPSVVMGCVVILLALNVDVVGVFMKKNVHCNICRIVQELEDAVVGNYGLLFEIEIFVSYSAM